MSEKENELIKQNNVSEQITDKKKNPEPEKISYSQEILRKLIHLFSLSIPVSYIFLSQDTALNILLILSFVMVTFDLLSKGDNIIGTLTLKFFGKMLRKHERKKKFILTGASWVLISGALCVFIFPKLLTIVAFTILIISDICAALFGRRFGKHKLFDKSWEGTIAFIISANLIILIYGFVFSAPWTFFAAGILSAVAGGFVEAASKFLAIDDNISIPVSVGLVLWGGGLLADIINVPFLNILAQ